MYSNFSIVNSDDEKSFQIPRIHHPWSIPSLIETLTLPHLSCPNTRKTSRTSGTSQMSIDFTLEIKNPMKSIIWTRNTTLINKSDAKADSKPLNYSADGTARSIPKTNSFNLCWSVFFIIVSVNWKLRSITCIGPEIYI